MSSVEEKKIITNNPLTRSRIHDIVTGMEIKTPRLDEVLTGTVPETYSDSWPRQVTRRELKRELAAHGLTLGDWDAEHDEIREYYNSQKVLGWLGY